MAAPADKGGNSPAARLTHRAFVRELAYATSLCTKAGGQVDATVARRAGEVHTRTVAEEGLLYGDRVWFADQRTPVRRMAVSCHVEHGVFVLSLWQADVCTGTFRLPMADAPDLIAKLVDGLADPDGGPDLRVVE